MTRPRQSPTRIAALFVETDGCYFGLDGVDPWDITRDARLYAGPHPVVAHPPCERWGRFATGSPMQKQYTLGDDGGCFESALAAVNKFGGVLEHPAHSKAWEHFRLLKPDGRGWRQESYGKWFCQVEQGHYGHVARKPTWLYVVTMRNLYLQDMRWGPSPQRLPAKRLKERGYESARRCGAVANQSHLQRQRTPIPFRDLLLDLARKATL